MKESSPEKFNNLPRNDTINENQNDNDDNPDSSSRNEKSEKTETFNSEQQYNQGN